MPSRSLADCSGAFRDAYLYLRDAFESARPGRRLIVTCTYRSPEEQFEAYKIGRRELADGSWVLDDNPQTSIVTQLDGLKRKSKHNESPSRAIDFAVIVGGKVSWDVREYLPVGPLATRYHLVWGGSWTTLKDYAHLEWPDAT